MPIFCISDLHLCDRGPRDCFAYRGEDRFRRFLDYLDGQGGQLRILGDLLDWWQCNLSRSVMAYRDLLTAIEFTGIGTPVWVTGNHDSALTEFIGTFIELRGLKLPTLSGPFESVIGNRKFAFLHGHESDNYCSAINPGIGEITAIISALLEEKNKGPVHRGHLVEDSFISALEAPLNLWRHLTLQAGRRDEMIDNVEKYRKAKQADVVVLGHSHQQGRIGNHHFNCGCWCRDRDGFTRIEDDGTVSMWSWMDDHAEPFEGLLR
jgi:UDP-2,3-diacylglucosamine pyrophosphatase LpxH